MLKRAKFLVITGLLLAITASNVNAGGRRSRIGGPRQGSYSSGVIERVGGVIFGNRADRSDIQDVQTDCCGHPEDPPVWNPKPAPTPTPEPWNPPTSKKHGGLSTGEKVGIGVGILTAGIVTYKLTHRHRDEDKEKKSEAPKEPRSVTTTQTQTRAYNPPAISQTPTENLYCIANRYRDKIALYHHGRLIHPIIDGRDSKFIPETIALWPIPAGINPRDIVTKVSREIRRDVWSPFENEAVEVVLCTDPPAESDQ